uniref:C2H2-type domain-containing protein n=1 Tax=Trichogramma kaykai TaxID=54128 RepID=A0ABD2W237_9HYME
MESSGLFNSDVRVKEEPGDVSLSENYSGMIDKKPDFENFQLLLFPRENSIHTIRKCEENNEIELDNELEIVAECEDVKPNIYSLAVKKIDDQFHSHLQNLKYTNDYTTQSTIKIENAEKVKPEFFDDVVKDSNSNLDRELSEKNKKISVTKKFVFTGNNNNCDTCGKTFGRNYHLKRHIDSVHDKITHTCGVCGKKIANKSYLRKHMDSVHNGIAYVCDACGKSFSLKSRRKIHIDVVHKIITHPCDIGGKNFNRKDNLKIHIDSVHRKITHVCDMCGKKFTQKGNLKTHVDAKHSNGTYGKNSK